MRSLLMRKDGPEEQEEEEIQEKQEWTERTKKETTARGNKINFCLKAVAVLFMCNPSQLTF